jgi:hypothetical protein
VCEACQRLSHQPPFPQQGDQPGGRRVDRQSPHAIVAPPDRHDLRLGLWNRRLFAADQGTEVLVQRKPQGHQLQ